MNKDFVASYSGGKDSILAVDRMIRDGFNLRGLIIVYNTDMNRSWFHGIPKDVIKLVEQSIGVKIWVVETSGEEYYLNLEKQLEVVKSQGIDLCVFGDIDIEDHRIWCKKRCSNTGIKAVFPLWLEDRKSLVSEFIKRGYKANITVINTNMMSDKYLGKVLSLDLLTQLEKAGVDVCGENGEYHSFVSDGPLFNNPVSFKLGEKIIIEHLSVMPVETE